MILFDNELKQLENAIANVVDETLSNIYRKFVDIDYVLDDNDGSFKNYFLERASSRLSSSYSAFVIKARSNKRNRNATIEIIDDIDSRGSNSTVDETLYDMKQEVMEHQETTQSHFESIKSPYSDVSTISATSSIKAEIIENSSNIKATQSNSEPTISFSSDAKANVIGEIKSETIEEPKAKGNDEPVEMKTRTVNEIKSAKITKPKNKSVVSNKSTTMTSVLRSNVLFFYCVHCQDNSITSESFENVHEVQNHWLSVHAKLFQPFRFYAGLQCVCYLCKKTGSFKEILNHFIVRHPGRRIGITKCLTKNKCAICDFIGDNIADHFQQKHPITTNAAIFNPIRFSEDFLNELNAIDVLKKFKCRCCDDRFDTESQIIDHYRKSANHNLQKYPYEDLIEKLPPSYGCGLCDSILEEDEIQNHLRDHEINCPNCSSFNGTIRELESHHRLEHSNASTDKIKTNLLKGFLATKIIQSNGLILNKSNLLSPKDDESKMLCTLFETLRPNGIDLDKPESDSKKVSSMTGPKALDHQKKTLSTEKLPKSHRKRNVETALSSISLMNDSFHHKREDLPDRVKQEHLAKQKKIINNLYITGLPENDGTRNVLMDMFTRLCNHLNVTINDNDVFSIQKAWFQRNDIVVVLKETSKHESILMHANRIKTLQSDDFLRLKPGRRPQNVVILPEMTNHYKRLEKRAKDHIRNRLLFNSRISNRGLAVKVSENSMEEYVNSNRELDRYVLDNNKTISAPSTPKRAKMC